MACDLAAERRKSSAPRKVPLGPSTQQRFILTVRYQNALFGVAFVLQLLFERRHRETWVLCLAALATALAGGMLDWVSWGRRFTR
jgi:hypothetical protein